MFQIATSWGLLTHPDQTEMGNVEITIRGYSDVEPVALPADFASMSPLSVDKIASIYCPTRRDLFLEVKARKRGLKTWGRIAGPLIEQYYTGILDQYQELFDSNQSYESVKSEIDKYTKDFLSTHSGQLESLRKHSSDQEEYQHFVLLLKYTARYELAMLGADWALRRRPDSAPDVKIDHTNVILEPRVKVLGISSPSTPDFLLPGLKAIGDVKTGKQFQEFHRLTCAGYALAYESAHGIGHEIDFGIIYFIETHHKNFTSARTYSFVIDDLLRREFLDRRNEAYQIVGRDTTDPPPFADRDQYCLYCKFLQQCDGARP